MQSAVIQLCRRVSNLIHVKQQVNASPSASSWIVMSTGHGPDHPRG